MATGFGRSGRGQALLKALGQPVRRPGQPANEEEQPQLQQQTNVCIISDLESRDIVYPQRYNHLNPGI